ncbi:MAG TPA: hypothetical protein G4O11_09940 [Anaerolineae bacterium]|nr:hypothetical protein [Anaerolineae bacterium]
MNNPIFLWLIAMPLIGSPLIYLSGHLSKRWNYKSASYSFGVATLLATWLPYLSTIHEHQLHGAVKFSLGTISLKMDGLGLLIAGVALSLSTLVAIYSGPYM